MIEVISIDQLIPDPANTRKHSKKNLDAIKGSLARFGQQKPIVISKDNIVIAGNGTLEAAKALKWTELQVIRSELEGTDITAYGIADNRTGELAEWDDEALSQTLKSLLDEKFDLDSIGFSDKDLDKLLANNESKDLYTKKIQVPIYEPKDDKAPPIHELVDISKRNQLIEEIKVLNISNEEKGFLILAAERHAVFNYERIAEYYAHASKEVQCLMEKSALVIIDFDKAIENGFVALSEDLAQAYKDDE